VVIHCFISWVFDLSDNFWSIHLSKWSYKKKLTYVMSCTWYLVLVSYHHTTGIAMKGFHYKFHPYHGRVMVIQLLRELSLWPLLRFLRPELPVHGCLVQKFTPPSESIIIITTTSQRGHIFLRKMIHLHSYICTKTPILRKHLNFGISPQRPLQFFN